MQIWILMMFIFQAINNAWQCFVHCCGGGAPNPPRPRPNPPLCEKEENNWVSIKRKKECTSICKPHHKKGIKGFTLALEKLLLKTFQWRMYVNHSEKNYGVVASVLTRVPFTVILLPLCPAYLMHKNPQRRKTIHGMRPVGRKERLIDLKIFW